MSEQAETIDDVIAHFESDESWEYVQFSKDATEVTLDGAFSRAELLRIAAVMQDE